MTLYIVKMDRLTFDRGIYNGTEILGYYLNRETAEAVAEAHKKGITNRDAYIEEVEVNTD